MSDEAEGRGGEGRGGEVGSNSRACGLPKVAVLPQRNGAQSCQLFQSSKRSCKSKLARQIFNYWQLIIFNCKHRESHKTHLQAIFDRI